MPKRKYDKAIKVKEFTELDPTKALVGKSTATYHQNAIDSVLAQQVTKNNETRQVQILRAVKGHHEFESKSDFGDYLVGVNPFDLTEVLIDDDHLVAPPCPPHCDGG